MNVRKFIDHFDKEDFCKDSPRVISEGREDSVFFYIEEPKKNYLINSPSMASLQALDIIELKNLLPKFGKYEIEAFFLPRFLHSLLITGDITNVMNTTVLCVDDIWSCKFTSEIVRKVFFEKTFSIVKENERTIYLKLNIPVEAK